MPDTLTDTTKKSEQRWRRTFPREFFSNAELETPAVTLPQGHLLIYTYSYLNIYSLTYTYSLTHLLIHLLTYSLTLINSLT